MRDTLIKKIKDSLNRHIGKSCLLAENIADDLLANGVIVAPCKVGDTVYVTYAGYATTAKVLALYIDREGGMFDLQIKTKCENVVGFKMVIDKDNYTFSDVFLTEEGAEAEAKLSSWGKNGKDSKSQKARTRPYKCKHFKWTSWNHYGCKMWEYGCKLKDGLLGSCNGICERYERGEVK